MFTEVVEGLMELSDDELDSHIRALELQRRRLDAELVAAIAVAEHQQLPAVDEHRSINAYLRATINCSSSEASRLRGLARAVDHVDGLGDAWLAGRVGASQAARFSALHGNRRVRNRLGEFAPVLLEHAEHLPFADFAICADEFLARADTDGAHVARDDAVEHRDAHVRDVAGMVDVTAHGGDGLTASELIAIHRHFTEAEYRADLEARRAEFGDAADDHQLERSPSQHRFDAFANIFRAAAAAEGIDSTSDPLVNVVINDDTWSRLLAEAELAPCESLDGHAIDPFTGVGHTDDLLAELAESGSALGNRRCETTNGVQLHPHDVLRAAIAGHVRRVIVDADGVVIDLGRRRRLFTGAARDAAKLLIRRCEHPGCELPPDFCDADHAQEWQSGGATDQANSRVRCGAHNVAKTRRRWRSKRATNGRTYTIRSDGTIMLPVGVRPPTFPADDDPHDESTDGHTPAEIEHLRQLARARAAALTTR